MATQLGRAVIRGGRRLHRRWPKHAATPGRRDSRMRRGTAVGRSRDCAPYSIYSAF